MRERILQSFLQAFQTEGIPKTKGPNLPARVGFSILKGLEAGKQTGSVEGALGAGIAAGLFGPSELRQLYAKNEREILEKKRAKISLIPDEKGQIHKITTDPMTGDILSHEIVKDLKKRSEFTDRPLNLQEQQSFGVPSGTLRSQVSGQVPVAPVQRAKLAELEKAIPIIKELRSGITTIGLADTVLGTSGIGSKLTTQGISPATRAGIYKAKKKAFLAQLSRASGERGVLTDQDIERIQANIPGFYDTKESAENKLATIEKILKEIQLKSEEILIGSPFHEKKPSKKSQNAIKAISDQELLEQLNAE